MGTAKKPSARLIDRLQLVANLLNGNNKKVETLQTKIKDDLRPIIAPTYPATELSWIDSPNKPSPETFSMAAMFSTRRDALEMLLEKISKMSLETRYTIKHFSPSPEMKNRALKNTPTKASPYFGIEKGKMKFPDGQEITVKKFLNTRSEEEQYYAIILEAIDTGELVRLRQCGECERFFVARHLGQDYCKPTCQKLHDKRAAVQRAKNWRINKILQEDNIVSD